ncbi:hypothetical protein [Moraxella oculi]|uniref:Uncharacterized protein n=1 Tax=Moraxella oculi TaxID=2940516 RepID=A0ABW8U451_9GAMM
MVDVKQIIGKTLKNVMASIYFVDSYQQEIFMEDIVDICLIIDDAAITVSCNEDGESLDITAGNCLQKVDMGDHGVIKIKDMFDFLNLKDSTCIYDARMIIDENLIKIGLELSLDTCKIIIKNEGDQMVIRKYDA